ncbi:MAG: flagellar basal body P-ring formation chaperone FlgA [Deltaproteobacteria bacterium]|jgi:flagella basal body P-ring formation protein FlgA|nr:flagellar basal body P-ring formation chaperone FlgA [Deltaproteobacteria bacterium]
MTKITIKFLSLFLTIVLLGLATAGPLLAGVTVIFPPQNTVKGPRILLGDVANVAAETAKDQALADLIGAVDLGPSPSPGTDLILRRRQIEQKLTSSGAPVSDIRWLIPEEVTFTSDGQTTDNDSVRKIILDYLDRSEPYISGFYDLLNVTFSTPPALPPGTVEYRFSPQPSSNPAYLTGTIFFSVDGQDAGRLRVTAQVDLRVSAVVAVRDLPRGHVLSEMDLSQSQVPYAQAKGALTETEQALGQTLKTSVRTGAPIRDRDLIKTSMVKKGEVVTIIAQTGSLKITALGQAKQDGALGQTISVVNQDSKKTISAKVIGPSLVEVIF